MLTDIYSNDSTFSGLPAILGGNFTQILPVILQGNHVAIIGAYLQRLFLQPTFRILSLRLNIYVRQGKANQQFAAQVQSLSYNMSLSSSVTIPPNIAQLRSKKPFYKYIYPLQLLTRVYTTPNTFRDYAILTIYNNTMAKINNAILIWLHSSLSTFYSINTIEQSREEDNNNVVLLPPELLQILNPNSLPPLKLALKVGAPIILLQNLYP